MIVWSLVFPLLGCLGVLLFKKNKGLIAALSLLLSTINLLYSYPLLGQTEIIPWINKALTFSMLLDWLSFPIAVMISFISCLAAFFSIKYMAKEANLSLYYICLLLFSTGMLGVVLSINMVLFYLFWELMLIASYFLIAEWGAVEKLVDLKYFVYMSVAAVCLLFGLGWLYTSTGTFNFLEMHNVSWLVLLPLNIAFLIKLGTFPFHDWIPGAHTSAPSPVSAMLSGLMVNMGGYGLVRFASLFKESYVPLQPYLFVLGVFTIIFGALMVFRQGIIKKALAWSTVSQGGFLLFGAATLTSFGFAGASFYFVAQALTKALLFFTAGGIIYATGKRHFAGLGNLSKKIPFLGLVAVIGLLSLAGIPAFVSFQSEALIFLGGIEFPVWIALALFGTVLTLGYSLWFFHSLFLEDGKEFPIHKIPAHIWAVIIILAILIIIFGIYPNPLLLGGLKLDI